MSLFAFPRKLLSILLSKNVNNYPVEALRQDIEILEFCKPYSMASPQRLYATLQAVKYVIKNKIDGDFVECGVWRGGNSMIMAMTLLDSGINSRPLYLFDTFEGMSKPTNNDVDRSGQLAQTLLNKAPRVSGSNIWCVASMGDVDANIQLTGYPSSNVKLVKGDVAKTLDDQYNLPEKISLLRLDTDWYESTKKELDVLFPRLVIGGVCLIDDYGHWQGARKAVDEYLMQNQLFPLVHVTDYTGRIFIKS